MSEEEISKNFVNNIKNWLSIDDNILKYNQEMSKIRAEIKKLNTEKEKYEKSIIQELDAIQTTVISVSDGKIKKSIRKIVKPLKREDIQKSIFEFTKDEKKSFDLVDQMMKNRKFVEKINLKRTKDKESVIQKN
jgi:predicted RNA-binding protein with RPS1 domain